MKLYVTYTSPLRSEREALEGWAGGHSTDCARVKHVHISYSAGGRE